jgi:hypothetical protein
MQNVGGFFHIVVLDGLVVSIFAIGPKVRGFNSGRGRCI